MAMTKDEAIARARALAPAIAERAGECEELRRPHDDTIRELIESDLLGLLVPSRFGGHELGLDTMAEVVFEISRACMSTGWIAAFYIGHNWMACRFDPELQEEVFAGKNHALIPGSTVPTLKVAAVDGGYRVSGKASWGSGIMHADWVIMSGIREDGEVMTFMLPVEDVAVGDVWHMTAMAGTGSNDMICEDAFVPAHRAMPLGEFYAGDTAGTRQNGPFYAMPILPFVYCEVMGVYAGALRGAVDAFDANLQKRARLHTNAAVKEKQYSHIQLGKALTAADIAEELMRSQCDLTDACMAQGGFSMADRARLKGHAGFLVDHCRRAVNELVSHSSADIFNEKLPLQRFFRDMNMLATHAFFEWDNAREQYGRIALGLEPNHPLI